MFISLSTGIVFVFKVKKEGGDFFGFVIMSTFIPSIIYESFDCKTPTEVGTTAKRVIHGLGCEDQFVLAEAFPYVLNRKVDGQIDKLSRNEFKALVLFFNKPALPG